MTSSSNQNPPTSVNNVPTSLGLTVGQTVSFTASVSPSGASQSLKLSTYDTSKISIAKNGNKFTVKGLALTSAPISFRIYSEANPSIGTTCTLMVYPDGTGVTIIGGNGTKADNKTNMVTIGHTLKLTAKVQPSGASQSVNWSIVSSSPSGAVTLSNTSSNTVTVTGVTAGTAVIRATSTANSTKYKNYTVKVKPLGSAAEIIIYDGNGIGNDWHGHAEIAINGVIYAYGGTYLEDYYTLDGSYNGTGALVKTMKNEYLSEQNKTKEFTVYTLDFTSSERTGIINFYESLITASTNNPNKIKVDRTQESGYMKKAYEMTGDYANYAAAYRNCVTIIQYAVWGNVDNNKLWYQDGWKMLLNGDTVPNMQTVIPMTVFESNPFSLSISLGMANSKGVMVTSITTYQPGTW